MYKLFLSLILLSNYFVAVNAQNNTVLSDIIPIQDVSWKLPDDSLFLVVKRKTLNSNLILLCESDHGHGTSLDAQSRLLRSLIDSSEIKVLYLEANWMNCERITEHLEKEKDKGIITCQKYMQSVELKYWVHTGFWDYLARKIIDGKIILRGVDIDGLSPIIAKELYGEASLIPYVDSFLRSNDSIRNDVSFVFDGFEGINSATFFFSGLYSSLSSFVDIVISYYRNVGNEKRTRQWESIKNLFYWIYKRGEVTKQNKIANVTANDKQFSSYHSLRDRMMAEIFLSYNISEREYRVVCSVSSYHGLRNSFRIEKIEDCCKGRLDSTMFEIVAKRASEKKIYSICFITASGAYGINSLPGERLTKVKKPQSKSIERVLAKSGLNYGFYEFKLNEGVNRVMNVIFNRYLCSDWGNNYSAFFFIRQMNPTKFY